MYLGAEQLNHELKQHFLNYNHGNCNISERSRKEALKCRYLLRRKLLVKLYVRISFREFNRRLDRVSNCHVVDRHSRVVENASWLGINRSQVWTLTGPFLTCRCLDVQTTLSTLLELYLVTVTNSKQNWSSRHNRGTINKCKLKGIKDKWIGSICDQNCVLY